MTYGENNNVSLSISSLLCIITKYIDMEVAMLIGILCTGDYNHIMITFVNFVITCQVITCQVSTCSVVLEEVKRT